MDQARREYYDSLSAEQLGRRLGTVQRGIARSQAVGDRGTAQVYERSQSELVRYLEATGRAVRVPQAALSRARRA
jgi:hypothetical protein